MKRMVLVLGVLAVAGAAAIAALAEPRPLEERLVDIQVVELLPDVAAPLRDESRAMKEAMLSFADEPLLLLKAKAAYLRYPDLARELFPLYGHAPEFRAVLAEYGEQVLLPVAYFLHNEVRTVSALHAAGHRYRSAVHSSREFFASTGAEPPVFRELSDVDRGWYAVNFIAAEGYNFLGQFVVDGVGQPRWIQSERFAEGFTSFFLSGIRGLETTVRTDADVTGSDLAWAAVDVAIVVGVAKLAAVGSRAVAGGARATTTSARVAGLRAGGGIARSAQALGLPRLAIYAAIAYTVVRHPYLINDALAALAGFLGLPPWLVLGAGWALILFPLFWLLAVLGGLLARPVAWWARSARAPATLRMR